MHTFCLPWCKVSLGYCQNRYNYGCAGAFASHWPKSAFGSSLTCLALCEIVDKKDDFTTYPGKDARNPGTAGAAGAAVNMGFRDGIHVVPREDLVRKG